MASGATLEKTCFTVSDSLGGCQAGKGQFPCQRHSAQSNVCRGKINVNGATQLIRRGLIRMGKDLIEWKTSV